MALLKSGDLWYYRTPAAIDAEVAYSKPIKIALASFNHLNAVDPQYIMLFDLTQIPEDGALPLVEMTVAPIGIASYTPAFDGRVFTKGLVIALSSTAVQLTKAAKELTCQIEGRII
jgi:hypothetical protein